jgi:flagellar motility protein MotE (MotC chaperone)
LLDFKAVTGIASSEFVFAILFIASLVFAVRMFKDYIEKNRQETTEREQYIQEMHNKQMDELKDQLKLQRDDSQKREQELMRHLGKNTEQLSKNVEQMQGIAETIKHIQLNLSKLEDRVEDNFLEVWKELGNKNKGE